jgi:predicted translin family RNA/ssDNA-binding protein
MNLISLKQSIKAYEAYQKKLSGLHHNFGLVRKNSKHVIALLRRDHIKQANKKIKEVESLIKQSLQDADKVVTLPAEGFYREAIEEYVEAKIYHAFVTSRALTFPKYINLSHWDMLGGWSDFTGELVRRAISLAHEQDISEIKKLKEITEKVVELFSQVSFSGKLRNKYDATERNLKRLEEILYELQLRN